MFVSPRLIPFHGMVSLPTFTLIFTLVGFFLPWCFLAQPLNAPLLPVYDYIVVGGGPSGLTVANRLTEDPTITVLVIEAGPAYASFRPTPTQEEELHMLTSYRDNYEEVVQVPVFVGQDAGGSYDWNILTTPQSYLDGVARPYPLGRVLGGGTILNAMLWNRGGQGDYDDWVRLGNPNWSWNDLLPYFRKSEKYTPVYSEAIAEQYSIHYEPEYHGFDGPVNVSFPKYFYNESVNFFNALSLLGVPIAYDPNDGVVAGGSFLPQDIDPNNQTRADARRSWYDPFAARDNFYVSTGQHVTQLIFEATSCSTGQINPVLPISNNLTSPSSTGSAKSNDGSFLGVGSPVPPPVQRRQNENGATVRIIGVEYASGASVVPQTVLARREVILAAGAVHSPQILQLSGIGPRALLESYNISVTVDSPGVGNNLQDHYLVGTFYPYNNVSYTYPTELTINQTFNDAARSEYYANRTGPWTFGPPDGVAFPSLPVISSRYSGIIASATNQTSHEYLVAGLGSTVLSGYSAQKKILIEALGNQSRAAYELLNNNLGNLVVSVMHPLSRGTCMIGSAQPFDSPVLDPRYGSNPVDLQILVEALRFNRAILATPPMVELQPAQFVPPVDADDDALLATIKNGIQTEYHPSGTCAMLPQNFGGVVDPDLLVYGTSNLRVVDASIFPLLPAAHLQAVVYAVAEKAADIIKAANAGRSLPDLASPSNTLAIRRAGDANQTAACPGIPTSLSNSISSSQPFSGTAFPNTSASSLPSPSGTTTLLSSSMPMSITSVASSFSALPPYQSQATSSSPLQQPSSLPGSISAGTLTSQSPSESLSETASPILSLPTSTLPVSITTSDYSSQGSSQTQRQTMSPNPSQAASSQLPADVQQFINALLTWLESFLQCFQRHASH